MFFKTLFDGKRQVFDAMVFINFHGLNLLEKFFLWSKGEIILVPPVKREASSSRMGKIDWNTYIKEKKVTYHLMDSEYEQSLFSYYLSKKSEEKEIHTGEASALAGAIANNWGLVSDERVVRKEYDKVTCKKALHSWNLVDLAVKKGFLNEKEAEWIKKGIYYV